MSFEHLSVTQFKAMIDEPVTVVDIRDERSFAAGAIENAISLNNDNVDEFVANADKTIPLVVCCYHGNSSQGVADYMSDQGFDKVYSLDGGYQAWAMTQL